MLLESSSSDFRFNNTLIWLARLTSIDDGDLGSCFKEINFAVSEALNVDRVSIWLFTSDDSALICHSLFQRSSKTFSCGDVLEVAKFPVYFGLLKQRCTQSIDDVFKMGFTAEFSSCYLVPSKIKSMLYAPIMLNEKIVGVISCESTDLKQWSIHDQNLVSNITDILSRAIQARERINSRHSLEQELLDQKRKTYVVSKLATLGEMTGAIVHEINNPLSIILGFTAMLKKMETDPEVSAEEKCKVLNDINETTLRIDKILKGLRFFSRDDTNDALTPSSIELILENTLSLCRQKFYHKDCKIIINIPVKNLVISCHPVSISQAILNLLGNSFNAIKDNPVKWVKIDCLENKNHIKIQVTDSGNGIDPLLHQKIMRKGTGLGLSIVQEILEEHGGSFSIDTTSANTSFIMKFPKQGR